MAGVRLTVLGAEFAMGIKDVPGIVDFPKAEVVGGVKPATFIIPGRSSVFLPGRGSDFAVYFRVTWEK